MQMLRRRRFAGMALAFTLPVSLADAFAETVYPNRPIRLLVGSAAGNSTDAMARQLAQHLADLLHQPVIVDNKPGAHGLIVGEAAKRADKDGYTLLVSSSGPITINPSLYKKLPYDPLVDFAPVASIVDGYLYLAVNNALPVKNLPEFVRYVKARPGQLSYGSGGSGTSQHLAMELLKKELGLDIAHIPYRGAPMVLQDLIGGQIACAFDAGSSVLPQAAGGKVRLIGVSSLKRLPGTPDLPTLAEQGATGFNVSVWSGLFAPAGTPAPVLALLNERVNQILHMPDFVEFLRKNGGEPAGGSRDEFGRFVISEIARWAPIVKASGAQVD